MSLNGSFQNDRYAMPQGAVVGTEMKASELIAALENEIAGFGDVEITVYCPEHSGESGDPIAVHGLGWFCGQNGKKSSFIECWECHDQDMRDKCEADALEVADYSNIDYDEY